MTEKKTGMLLFTTVWGIGPTFSMMPLSPDCPFTEVVYDMESRQLVVLGREKRQVLKLVTAFDRFGEAKIDKRSGKPEVERKSLDLAIQYTIYGKAEQINFIKMFAVNADTYDYKKYLDYEPPQKDNGVKVEDVTPATEAKIKSLDELK